MFDFISKLVHVSYFEQKMEIFCRSSLTSIVRKDILWKSMGTINCLITNILQNIFYVQYKKLIQVWNDMGVSK